MRTAEDLGPDVPRLSSGPRGKPPAMSEHTSERDLPDDAIETTMESATEGLVDPQPTPDPDGPDASTVDSGGGPQQGASDDRDA